MTTTPAIPAPTIPTKPPVPVEYLGDGAWRNPASYHQGMTLPVEANDRTRARLAMMGLKSMLRAQDYLRPLAIGQREDPGFGPQVDTAIKSLQRSWGLPQTGKIRKAEAFVLFFPAMYWWQVSLGIPDNLLIGAIGLESGFDPGAEGRVDPDDRGLGQLSEKWRPWITDEMAYGDPAWCIQYVAGDLVRSFEARWPLTEPLGLDDDARIDLAWDCAIAAHNNPEKSKVWARTGEAPDDQIRDYVRYVRRVAGRPL